MSHMIWDEDEWESEVQSRPCTACGGDPRKCNGLCNGTSSIGWKRRAPEEVARIKAEKQRTYEDQILAQADAIRARRQIA